MKRSRKLHYAESPSGWTYDAASNFAVPAEVDRNRDHVILRRDASDWIGILLTPPAKDPFETYRNPDREVVIAWARSTGVDQILIEDEQTRDFTILT